VVCPEEALLFLSLGAVSSILPYKHGTNQSSPSLSLRWLQGEWLRAKTDRKMETETGGVDQVVDQLPSELKVPSSKPQHHQKEKKRKKDF
jgi:hypothetical protein